MKIDFALFLSPGGIALAHRQDAGHWSMIAETSLEVADLAAALKTIRLAGETRSNEAFKTLLVLPDDQILYTKFPAYGEDAASQRAHISRNLDGLTPYALDELTFDWRDQGDGRVAVAVVAKETLQEAQDFARVHGFNGVAFAASPPAERFPDVPIFTISGEKPDVQLAGSGLQFGPDEWTPEPAPQMVATAKREAANPETSEDGGEASSLPSTEPTPSFKSRRGAADTTSGKLVATREPRLDLRGTSDVSQTVKSTPLTATKTTPAAPQKSIEVSAERSPEATQPPSRADTKPPKLSTDVFQRITGITPDEIDINSPDTQVAKPTRPMRSGRGIGSVLASLSGGSRRSRTATATPEPQFERATSALHGGAEAAVPSDPDAKAQDPAPKPMGGKTVFSTPPKTAGPSVRLGLMLTVMLLLGLALLALWSILFMPQGSIARLFGLNDAEIALAVEPSIEETFAEDDMLAGLTEPQSILPDIDADMDFPELADAEPELTLPSLEETEQFYAVNGIWQRPPEYFTSPQVNDDNHDIYTASIDPIVPVFDAFALAIPQDMASSDRPGRFASPPPFGTRFTLDQDGLVAPTPEGALTAQGVRVVLGTPPVLPVPRNAEAAPEGTDIILAGDVALAGFRPTERPSDLQETRERQLLGGLSRSELASFRPTTRPPSVQEVALATRAAEERQAEALAAAASASAAVSEGREALIDLEGSNGALIQLAGASDLAIARSSLPSLRPADIEELIARAQRATDGNSGATVTTASAPAPQASSSPSIPSNASVSRAATMENAISLRNINLIGVSGSESNRRALVRLSSGRFVTVTVGDRLDGGRVAAIGAGSLQYVKNGRNISLDVPQG